MPIKIEVPETDLWSEKEECFIKCKATTLVLEHSLVSVKKWEQKWHKPFLSKETKTPEMMFDYIKFMTITQNVDENVYYCIPEKEFKRITEYIEDSMTATTFSDDGKKSRNTEIMTNEVIYYYMFANQIPKECEKWHLNSLMTLLRVFSAKNEPAKKEDPKTLAKRYASLNAQRRKALHSRG